VTRELVVNADDFGRTPGINRGVIHAHENGIVTTASVMVRWPAAADAVAYARAAGTLGLGLHLDLGEWVYRNESWGTEYEVVDVTDPGAVEAEVGRQLAEFRRLARADPTHLDSHQHVHRNEPVRSVMRTVAAELGVPLREEAVGIHFLGDFYGQDQDGNPFPAVIGPARLIEIVGSLPAGITELMCHPGLDDDSPLPYVRERALEVEALCDPDVRAAIATEGIVLRRFPARATLR
jgi:chitin disaccharide deacetylase